MDLRNIFSYVAICTCTRFGSSVNISISIGQKSFVFSKYTSKWKASTTAIFQQVWQYHKSCIYLHFQSFPWLLRRLRCLLQSHVGQFLFHLWRTLCPSEISFFIYELSNKIPCQILTLPPPKYSKNVHLYWMTEFSANFYISSNFFNILNRFQTIFTSEVNDRPIWNDSEKHNTWS